MKNISFGLALNGKKIIFSSAVSGLVVDGREYLAEDDGVLIYDKTKDIHSTQVICQMSTNTSTLIPSFRILEIPYNPYFDNRKVVESQNDITFYWDKSKLATFYNRFSTDGVDMDKREEIIRKAVDFLINTAQEKDFLQEEYLRGLEEPCRLLGFYKGFPIFDAHVGIPQLKSALGIHLGVESVMVSTPLDKYSQDVYSLAQKIEKNTGVAAQYKKNRVRFDKDKKIIAELGV